MKAAKGPMRLAYSYIRFSTPEQKKGDSKRRQLDESDAFCQENNLVLEKSRKFYDEGRSAFKGTHLSEGRLGDFLKLIEAGRVPRGSVLIVEAFDRLNRQDTLKALKTRLAQQAGGMEPFGQRKLAVADLVVLALVDPQRQ